MRVALNLEQLLTTPSGGVGRYTAELARLLPALAAGDADDRVEFVPFVALHRPPEISAALEAHGVEGVTPIALPLPRPLLYDAWHVLGRPRLDRLVRRERVDLVHAPSVAVPPVRTVPLVVTVHDAAPLLFPETYPRRGRRFHERGIAAAARRADLVITVSQAAADELDEHTDIPPDRVRVVPNGVDLTVASDAQVAEMRVALDLDDRPYVLWVGSLEPRKDVGTLVESFARWSRADDPPHRLVLVGAGGWVEDRERVLSPGRALGERVRTLGRLDGATLRALYRGSDVLALPSRHEGFGLPALEAMAQGTAVIASDIAAVREVTGDAAVLVALGDVDGWVAALTAVIGDHERRRDLGEAGRIRAQRYSWERSATATRDVYREAIAR